MKRRRLVARPENNKRSRARRSPSLGDTDAVSSDPPPRRWFFDYVLIPKRTGSNAKRLSPSSEPSDEDSAESESEQEINPRGGRGMGGAKRKRNIPAEMSNYLIQRRAGLETTRKAENNNLLDLETHRCPTNVGEECTVNGFARDNSKRCEWLELLFLAFDRPSRSLFCHTHGIFLSSVSCVRHIVAEHKEAIPYRHDKTEFVQRIVAHLAEVAGYEICENADDIHPPGQLHKPLLISKANNNIRYRFQCPICTKWITRNETYRGHEATELFHNHFHSDHPDQPRPDLTALHGSWCQAVLISGPKGGRTHVFELIGYARPTEPTSSAASLSTNRIEGPPQATWFQELKWHEYHQQLGRAGGMFVQSLVKPRRTKYQLEAIQDNEFKWLEWGISNIQMLVTGRIREAQTWAANLHGIFFKSLKPRDEMYLAPFRLIRNETILSYRRPLSGVVGMLMRLCWHKLGKSRIQREPELAEKLLKATDPSQRKASVRLYAIILALKGKKHETMSLALDQLLEAILCPEGIGIDHIACPTELYVFAAFWTANGHRTAQSVVSICCKLQFCLRIIFTQLVKRDVCNAKETSNQPPKEELQTSSGAEAESGQFPEDTEQGQAHEDKVDHREAHGCDGEAEDEDADDEEVDDKEVDEEDADEEDADDEDADEEDADDEDADDEDADDDLDCDSELLEKEQDELIKCFDEVLGAVDKAMQEMDASEQTEGSGPSDHAILTKALSKYRPWVTLHDSGLPVLSPFQRNSKFFMAAAFAAKEETTGASITTSFDGNRILIHQPPSIQLTIKLSAWENLAQRSIMEFLNAIDSLLPDGLPASGFPVGLLSDDLDSPRGPHHQSGNSALITGWKKKILDKLLHPMEKRHSLIVRNQLSYPSLLIWLRLEQEVVLPTLSKVAALTCVPGISEWKYGYLRFDGDKESSCHIFLLKNGLCCFQDPAFNLGISSVGIRFYAFPAEVTKALCLYLYVIRPVACDLLQKMGCEHAFYSSHVWAHVKPHYHSKRAWTWSGPQVSTLIKKSTAEAFGIILTPYLINKILANLFVKNLAEVFRFSDEESPVDRQAQHVRLTSLQNYGWVSNHFPPLKYLRLHHPLKHLAASEVWHALLRLGHVCAAWSGIAMDSPLVGICVRRQNGVDTALEMVTKEYLVLDGQAVEMALKKLPFLSPQPVQFWDNVLVTVTSRLLPATILEADDPFDDYAIEAAVVIMQVLHRIQAKKENPNMGILESRVQLEYDKLRKVLVLQFNKFSGDRWKEFQLQVVSEAQ